MGVPSPDLGLWRTPQEGTTIAPQRANAAAIMQICVSDEPPPTFSDIVATLPFVRLNNRAG